MKVKIEYVGGSGRHIRGAVDYMLGIVAMVDADVELYAELPQDDEDETGTYDELRELILEQADEHGIPKESLQFWFDVV
ncbi:MAG: hypothetical protein DDT29_02152 [Dehalococcoidia bacterium]|nr:hypothetical protein [Bacillota bacterium]